MKNKPPLPTHEDIAVRAYQLWEAAGNPAGRDGEFWLQAERQLQAQALPPVAPPASPPPIPPAPVHAVPPVIREVVAAVARPPVPAPTKKRRAR